MKLPGESFLRLVRALAVEQHERWQGSIVLASAWFFRLATERRVSLTYNRFARLDRPGQTMRR